MAYPFELPELGYAFDALEPYIDARTMEIHHDKHHAGYTNKFNAAVEQFPELNGRSAVEIISNLDAVPTPIRTAVRNNGGGYVNHTLFWQIMTPGGPDAPQGDLAKAIDTAFESFEDFKANFQSAAAGQFGSGWAWLTADSAGNLAVTTTANQDSPYMDDTTPILGVDVWEHAYYLKYQNRRPDYLEAFWHVVNWEQVAERFAAAQR